jgi:hypothetical protein
MIKGARNRVPTVEYWDLYRNAERLVPGLVASMAGAAREYVEEVCDSLAPHEVEINSTKACSAVLKRSKDTKWWRAEFGDAVRRLFGMILWVVLFDDPDHLWETDMVDHRQRKERYYWIADDED